MWWLAFPAAALVFLAVILIRSGRERKFLSESVYEVPVQGLPDALSGTTFLFLSDLHDELFGEDNRRLTERLQERKADAVLVGGDMMTVKKRSHTDFHALETVLQSCLGKYPVYYALGNHETRMRDHPELYPGWYERFLSLLSAYEVTLLDNSSACFTKNGERIRISGFTLEREYYKKGHTEPLSVRKAEQVLGPKKEMPEVVLVHSPMYGKTFSAWGADLVLSGHFHGGTIRLPLLGGVMTPQFQFFSPLTKGARRYGKTTEIISGGLGTHSVRIRFMNPPDIVSVRLVREKTE